MESAPGEHSYRYGSTTGNSNVQSWNPSQVQVGNQQQDWKTVRDVGMHDATGRGPVQASKLENEEFPF